MNMISLQRLFTKCQVVRVQQIFSRKAHLFPEHYSENSSIYIHWPYCRKQCSYCNFVKFVPCEGSSWTFSNEIIINHMVKELEWVLTNSHVKKIHSVFFGGGTPSLAGSILVEKTIEQISKHSSINSDAEITLEANPYGLNKQSIENFKNAGINRISLGVQVFVKLSSIQVSVYAAECLPLEILEKYRKLEKCMLKLCTVSNHLSHLFAEQSLNNANLRLLNRDHNRSDALKCIELSRKYFPQSVSLDFIFGLPKQSLSDVENELKEIIDIADDHLSLYQLTLERGTPLQQKVREGLLVMPSDDLQADMYTSIVNELKEKGFCRYEVSNFARTPSAESRHNKGYWSGEQYIGIGPGAHSRIFNGFKREARVNAADPQNWLSDISHHGNCIRKSKTQNSRVILEEYLATSLRTRTGTEATVVKDLCGLELYDLFAAKIPRSFDDMVILNRDSLKVTDQGFNVLDSILVDLFNIINSFYSSNNFD